MSKLLLATTTALFLSFLAGCSVSAEDQARAKRRVELDTQQAAIVGDASDCSRVTRELDAWYAENKAEVDTLDAWMADTSERKEMRMMKPYESQRALNTRKRLMGTVRCGFVPWNGRREPGKT